MPKLTTEHIRNGLRAFSTAAPVRKELKPLLMSAIDVLPGSALEELLWTLTRPGTRWRLMAMLSPTIGAERAFAAVAQLPEIQEMPPGLLMAQKARMVKKGQR